MRGFLITLGIVLGFCFLLTLTGDAGGAELPSSCPVQGEGVDGGICEYPALTAHQP